jgi:hypothetical protein
MADGRTLPVTVRPQISRLLPLAMNKISQPDSCLSRRLTSDLILPSLNFPLSSHSR